MGMNTHIVGVRDLDKKFKDMMMVKKACDKADIGYPSEIMEYFGSCAYENEKYLRTEMEEISLDSIKKWSTDSEEGWEIDIKDIPKEAKSIRIVHSW
jgi:hypothetical protein